MNNCPILTAGTLVNGPPVEIGCMENKCALWRADDDACSITATLFMMKNILNRLDEIEDVLLKE